MTLLCELPEDKGKNIKKHEEVEEQASGRPHKEKASFETSSSLRGRPDLEPDSGAAPAAPVSQHSKDEERTTSK